MVWGVKHFLPHSVDRDTFVILIYFELYLATRVLQNEIRNRFEHGFT